MRHVGYTVDMVLELVYLFILSLVSFLWLKPGEMILGHDSGVRLNGWDYWRDTFFSWNPGVNFGKDWAIAKGFLVTKLPELVLTDLFGNTLGQQLTIAFWLFLMGASMYVAVRLLFPTATRLMRLWASTLYMYNFFVLQGWWIFERAKFATYAALPLVFAFLYKGLTRQYSIATTAIFIAVTLFFGNGGGSPPLYGALLVTGGVTLAFMTIVNIRRRGWKELLYSAKLVGAILAAWLLLNAYWIVPEAYLYATSYKSMLASMGGTEGILSWEAMFSTNASWLNILRLQGIPGWEAADHPYAWPFMKNPLLVAISLIPLLLALSSLLFMRKEKSSFRLLLILLILLLPIGVFFTAGTHPPLGFLFAAMIKYVPGFAIFRSSYFKFAPTVFFAISLLSAYSLSLLVSRFVTSQHASKFVNSHIRKLATAIVLLMLIAFHYPYFQPDSFRWIPPFTTKVTVPNYAYEATSYLSKNTKPTDRILLLPPLDPAFHQDSYTWGYWSLAPYLRGALSRPILANDSNNPPTIVDALYQSIRDTNEEQFSRLAYTAGVTHILWRDDILYNDRATDAASFAAEKHALTSFSSLKSEKAFGAWTVYQVSVTETPLVSTANDVIHVVDPTYDIATIARIAPDAPLIITTEDEPMPALTTHAYIRARCVYCTLEQFASLAGSIDLPHAGTVPNDLFYSAMRRKEITTLAGMKTPHEQLDAHLAYANRRIVELAKTTGTLAQDDLIANYHDHMNAIQKLLPQIEGTRQQEYAVRLYLYSTNQEVAMSDLPSEIGSKIKNPIMGYMSPLELRVVGPPPSDNRFYLHFWIPTDGTYTIRITDSKSAYQVLGTKPLKDGDTTTFSKGLHSIAILGPKGQPQVAPPPIYFTRVVAQSHGMPIQPIVTRINPTLVTVQMPKSETPTLLTINQHFAAGWKLVGPKQATEAKHIQVAGYANGWIIPALDKPTTFTITYFPQQIFYLGLGITIISFIATSFWLVQNRKFLMSFRT